MKIGFDNEKYLKIQSEHIKERSKTLKRLGVDLTCEPVRESTAKRYF